jgi:hypothetical protein
MFSTLLLSLLASPTAGEAPMSVQIRQGPMPAENIYLRPGHKNSDDRMFPDIAIGALSIDGDTLFVQVTNKGRAWTHAPIQVAARAEAGGVKSDLAQVRVEQQLKSGETRWVAVKGFSFKTAANSPAVFALENASAVSAVARLLPTTAGSLDRSGQGCGECNRESDQGNNVLTLGGSAIAHGRPN